MPNQTKSGKCDLQRFTSVAHIGAGSTMTIINRVVSHLRVHGHGDVADELVGVINKLGSGFEQLAALHKQQNATVRKLLFEIQSNCKHFEWYLVSTNAEGNPATWGPEDTIACSTCGHTVCDEEAYKFGKRVLRGDYFIYSRAGGRKFCLNAHLKRQLGDKLVAKEIGRGDDQEGLREAGDSAGKSAPP